MNLTHTKTYHERAQYHRKKTGSLEEAYKLTEIEYIESEGKGRYLNYKSFRQIHWQVITGKYRHLK